MTLGYWNAHSDRDFEDAGYAFRFLAILNRPEGCTCDLWRHPNDPDGGLCAWCEDAPFRELLEAHADGPGIDDLEEAEERWT